jgi:hypothetical protein
VFRYILDPPEMGAVAEKMMLSAWNERNRRRAGPNAPLQCLAQVWFQAVSKVKGLAGNGCVTADSPATLAPGTQSA